MHYFFSRNIQDGFIYFSPEEITHMQKSLRLHAGNEVEIMDGTGTRYICRLENTEGRSLRGVIRHTTVQPVRKCALHIAISPVKQMSRLEWFLEKSVEIGVESITPIWCRRSVRARIKMDRLEKVAISALKQSGQFFLPIINPSKKFTEYLDEHDTFANRYIAYCGKQLPLLSACLPAGSPSIVCIGPEGDFTPEEVEEAMAKGFKPVSLGNYRLRTETAGIYVCTIVKTLNEIQS